MSDILQYTASADVSAIKSLSKLAINHLLVNTVLVAGFKVKNKIGGPTMLVQGFIKKVPYDYKPSSNSNSQNILLGLDSCAMVRFNSENLTEKQIYKTESFTSKVPLFIFYKTPMSTTVWTTDDYLYIVCKRWSEKEQDFIHSIENLHELELVKD